MSDTPQRILAFDGASISFRTKDYLRDEAGRARVMSLSAAEFIRRFLLDPDLANLAKSHFSGGGSYVSVVGLGSFDDRFGYVIISRPTAYRGASTWLR